MNVTKTFAAAELMGVSYCVMSQFFSQSFKATLGHLALAHEPFGYGEKGTFQLAFYLNEDMLKALSPDVIREPRIIVRLQRHTVSQDGTALAHIEIEQVRFKHRIHDQAQCPVISGTAELILPDTILGLDNLIAPQNPSTYRGVFFNTTPGEYRGNLFDVVRFLGLAFAKTFETMQQAAQTETEKRKPQFV